MLDNYPALLEVNVKYCVLPKFLSLICIREGFIEKNRGTFQIGVDNPPPSNSKKTRPEAYSFAIEQLSQQLSMNQLGKIYLFRFSMNI